MLLHHMAFRVPDRKVTAQFFINAFGYRVVDEFDINFDDNTCAKCMALIPAVELCVTLNPHVHPFPEIFISDGDPDSIIGKWVAERQQSNCNFLHHMAYSVDSVEQTVKLWKDNKWAEFTSDLIYCPEDDLVQVFTKPHPLTGIIYEFIEVGEKGFCRNNIKKLMESTQNG